MNKKYERQPITSIDHVVPGLPLYNDIGEKIAGSLYDFFDYLSSLVSRVRENKEEV